MSASAASQERRRAIELMAQLLQIIKRLPPEERVRQESRIRAMISELEGR